jgi:hypothetical protein
MSSLPMVHQRDHAKCEHKPQHVGNWSIPVAQKDATLRLSCMGYLGIEYLAGSEQSAEAFGMVE